MSAPNGRSPSDLRGESLYPVEREREALLTNVVIESSRDNDYRRREFYTRAPGYLYTKPRDYGFRRWSRRGALGDSPDSKVRRIYIYIYIYTYIHFPLCIMHDVYVCIRWEMRLRFKGARRSGTIRCDQTRGMMNSSSSRRRRRVLFRAELSRRFSPYIRMCAMFSLGNKLSAMDVAYLAK